MPETLTQQEVPDLNTAEKETKAAEAAAHLGGVAIKEEAPGEAPVPQADKAERKAYREDLKARGFSGKEAYSITNNGYIMPEIYANQEPSKAALEQFTAEEDRKLAERVGRGEDISQPPAEYETGRQEVVNSLQARLQPEELDRVVGVGYGMPEAYNPHYYGDMLAARQAEEATAA